MGEVKLKPCPKCRKFSAGVERWASGGMMYMVKCMNPDCPVPYEGYPTGRNLLEVMEEWNNRAGQEGETE